MMELLIVINEISVQNQYKEQLTIVTNKSI